LFLNLIISFAIRFYKTKRQMIIIPIKDNEAIDRVLKKFKKKFERTGVVRELRDRQAFEKPSVTRRTEVLKAVYIQNLRREEGTI
jgi:small subunit ribosomal protein S21